ncbi:uncharacterized protein MRET_3808 [Malassezia restricta]|uniref:Uncharacterized protein n=1 Tax=Malassezia restricta (strain ATCC 96810 / NBRC 103918 / CBS 7877) TaxID=425264 RepID=A0A3G2SAY5_MALR7|nr:uncharacterized protein MRET_3808 [Malassezia restricta]AXA51922.1 uncharacterized protein MRET_3808 [Malassezia restricta]AYO44478.1 hypothetical protein DNF11_3528 [Malassezia restricta CBS 7877]
MMVSGSMRMLRAPASRSMGAVRGLHMTKVARGVQQPMSEAQTAEYPREGFNSRLWTLGIAAIAGGAATNYYLKKYVKGDEEAAKPFFTDLIESCSTSTDKIREANQEHIDLSIKRAEAQLMIQDAQKPSTHRVRFPYLMEQYPRRGLQTGSVVDTSDLQVNQERV